MSCRLPKDNLSPSQILEIKNELYVEGVESEYGPPVSLECYGESKSSLYLPFSYYNKKFSDKSLEKETKYEKREYKMLGELRDRQIEIYKETVDFLKKDRTVLLSAPPGEGKTFMGIKLSHKIGYKTAVLVHRAVLTEQWIESIQRFTTAKTQIVGTDDLLEPDIDFYIFNIGYVGKYYKDKKWNRRKLNHPEYLDIGTLIVDEAHIACASEMSKALQYFQPRYMIALTATPKRRDGLDVMLDLYFSENRVVRISQTPFTVYRVGTAIKPKYGTNKFGKKKWGDVVAYLSEHKKRNKLIVDLVVKNKKKIIMIMCKLKTHCDLLVKMLKDSGESVTVMKGSDKTYDMKARILVSTFSKLGVGFDDVRLDMLILASSVKDVEQYAGRLRYTPGKDRVIYDLVDDDYSCQKHWMERKTWYESRNGVIKYIKIGESSEASETERKRLAPKSRS